MVSLKVTSSLLALFLVKNADAFTPRNLSTERSRSASSALPMVRQKVMASFQLEHKWNLLRSRESAKEVIYLGVVVLV